MKKYEKPIVVIETFQLDAAIAGTCRAEAEAEELDYYKLGFGAETCIHEAGFFNWVNCEVDLAGPEEDGNDTDCYHGPIFGMVFINS